MKWVITMREQKKDLRIIKTKKHLYEGLISLLKEKAFEELKVADICEKALINRSTFYSHYSDKYDLLDALIKDIKASLKEELEKNKNISNTKEYYLEMLRILFEHINTRENFYSAILVNNQNSIVTDMIFQALNEDIQKRIENNNKVLRNKVPTEIVASFYLGAVFNMGIEWLKQPSKYTPEELMHYLNTLLPEGL